MTELKKYTEDIQRLCAAHKVRHMYAFGSILTDQFHSNSDIDLIVDFDPIAIEQYADNYYSLKFALQDIFHRNIDLLEEKAIKNPYFIRSIKDKKQLLYGH